MNVVLNGNMGLPCILHSVYYTWVCRRVVCTVYEHCSSALYHDIDNIFHILLCSRIKMKFELLLIIFYRVMLISVVYLN